MEVKKNHQLGFLMLNVELTYKNKSNENEKREELTLQNVFGINKESRKREFTVEIGKKVTPYYSTNEEEFWIAGFDTLEKPHMTLLSRCDVGKYRNAEEWLKMIDDVMLRQENLTLDQWIKCKFQNEREKLMPNKWKLNCSDKSVDGWYITMNLDVGEK